MDIMFFILIIIGTIFASVSCREIRYSLNEENDQNHILGNISKDADIVSLLRPQDNFSDIRYSLLTIGSQFASLFIVDSQTSILRTSQRLDRDVICMYKTECVLSFDVVATASDFFTKITVKVTLNDINDHAPTFPDPVVSLKFLESSVVGSNVPLAGADDVDTGNNSVQNYSVVPNDVPFSVNAEYFADGRSSLRLVLSKKLDREIKDKYRFQVLAEDRGNPVKTGTVIIDVEVQDVNDNPPKFINNTYNISIAEDLPKDSMILRVKALDPDLGENGRILYRLSQQQSLKIRQLFAIHPSSGELSIQESLIQKGSPSYEVIVEASDNATTPLISKAQVFVSVLDTHNTAPVIRPTLLLVAQRNSSFIQISENVKNGTVIALVSVTDPDKGLNGQVECFSNDSNFHLLEDETNEYNIAVYGELNRENSEWIKVQIMCKDTGSPPLNAYATISIKLLDLNDNVPKFTKDVYQTRIPENVKADAIIFQVSAIDNDVTPSNITYFINESSDASSKFYINSKTGTIFCREPIDREITPFVSILLTAQDNQLPVQTGSAVLEITVTDVNDNAPHYLPGNFVFNVLENKGPETFVGNIIANDKDKDENAEIDISGVNMSQLPFKILNNGSVYTTAVLDRETRANYTFLVVAKDKGSPVMSSFTNVTIRVSDENDNDPKISVPEVLRISQFTLPNTVVLPINASDPDFDTNSRLLFEIGDHDNVSNILSVSKFQGQLTLKRSLTFDDVGYYKCIIIVKDMGTSPRTSSASFTIFINQDEVSTQRHTSEVSIKYYAIAVAICCVTIVLSAVIILVICLIRRKDRLEGDKTNSSITSQVTQESDLSQMDVRMSGLYNRDYIQGTLTKSFSGRKKEKQVTFKSPYIAPQIKVSENVSLVLPD